MTNLISLITTVYNRERYLPKAIESVLAQSYPDFELIIWDDGSTDHSLDIAYHYANQDKRIRVISSTHHGRGSAVANACTLCKGNYIGLVDSDDLLAETALEETVLFLNHNPEVGLVYTDYIVIDEEDTVKQYGTNCQVAYSKERLLTEYMVFHFRLLRSSIYTQIGGFDPSFTYCQDYDLCLKVSEVTEIAQIHRPLYYYRQHKRSISHENRIEQLIFGKRAIEDALHRRGLSETYELEFQVFARCTLLHRAEPGKGFGDVASESYGAEAPNVEETNLTLKQKDQDLRVEEKQSGLIQPVSCSASVVIRNDRTHPVKVYNLASVSGSSFNFEEEGVLSNQTSASHLSFYWSLDKQQFTCDEVNYQHSGTISTTPSHDLVHLIVAANGGLLWLPSGERKLSCLAEFNAVFLENLFSFIYDAVVIRQSEPTQVLEQVFKYMQWFVEQHFAPFPVSFEEACQQFLLGIKPAIISHLFPYYAIVRQYERDCSAYREAEYQLSFTAADQPAADDRVQLAQQTIYAHLTLAASA